MMEQNFESDQLRPNKIKAIEVFTIPPRFALVRVITEAGESYGDITLESHTETVMAMARDVAPFFVGKDANRITIGQDFLSHDFYSNSPVQRSVAAGIETALWDILGRRLEVPLYQLFGGLLHTKGLPYYRWVGGNTPEPDSAVEQALRVVEEIGALAIKLNACPAMGPVDVHGGINQAREVAKALSQALPSHVSVAYDGHGRLKPPSARKLIEALRPYNPLFIEEPVEPAYEHELPAIRQMAGGIPIATGERMYGSSDFFRLATNRGVDIFQPDMVHVGGIINLRRIASIADAAGLGIAPHCPLSAIAFMGIYQCMVTSRSAFMLECADGIHYNDDAAQQLGENPWLFYIKNKEIFKLGEDGLMPPPPGPGLGIEFDAEALQRGSKIPITWERKPHYLKTGLLARS
jgi:galactonate dehydratase